ncbi:zinc transporter 10-like [Xyrauchen texanus]|uniref:zinc transporter 10-like n=1 Tax=Xyrauchen texanus TaxID=154827 RepID=UPI002242A5D5|nr:zinc transporter 10-like [Xyrauchen texanus]
MARISAFLGGSTRTCILVLTFAFLVCEIVVGQICRSILIVVDSFHTLYMFIHMALSGLKHQPKASVTNPNFSSPSFPESHKSDPHSPFSAATSTTPGPSNSNISLPADPASDPTGAPSPLPDGECYSRMRLKPFGILISSLLLASQCVSISLEILNHLVQPEPIQHQFLSIVVGAASLLFNITVLAWRSRTRGMNKAIEEFNKCPELTKTVPHSASEDKERALEDDALVFCNPKASSVLDPDQGYQDCPSSCSELPNPHTIKPVIESSPAQNSTPYICESSQEVFQPTIQHPEEPIHSTCMDPTDVPLRERSSFERLKTGCFRLLISGTQELLGSVLILVNGLVFLLFEPQCHCPHSHCHPLVYLDAILSIVVVLVLLATVLPKLYRYGLLVLQATPLHLCVSQVRLSLAHIPGVLSVHELHVWQLSDACIVASVHVHCPGGLKAAECSDLMLKITGVLSTFGINHCTVQPELLTSDRSDSVVSEQVPVKPVCSLRCGQECAEKLCCSPRVEKSCSLQKDGSTSPKKGSSDCRLEESSCCLHGESLSPASSSVGMIRDIVIENTYL